MGEHPKSTYSIMSLLPYTSAYGHHGYGHPYGYGGHGYGYPGAYPYGPYGMTAEEIQKVREAEEKAFNEAEAKRKEFMEAEKKKYEDFVSYPHQPLSGLVRFPRPPLSGPHPSTYQLPPQSPAPSSCTPSPRIPRV